MIVPLDDEQLRIALIRVFRASLKGPLDERKRRAAQRLIITYSRASAILDPQVDEALRLLPGIAVAGLPRPANAVIHRTLHALERHQDSPKGGARPP